MVGVLTVRLTYSAFVPLCENNSGPFEYFAFACWHKEKLCQERRWTWRDTVRGKGWLVRVYSWAGSSCHGPQHHCPHLAQLSSGVPPSSETPPHGGFSLPACFRKQISSKFYQHNTTSFSAIQWATSTPSSRRSGCEPWPEVLFPGCSPKGSPAILAPYSYCSYIQQFSSY